MLASGLLSFDISQCSRQMPFLLQVLIGWLIVFSMVLRGITQNGIIQSKNVPLHFSVFL